MSRYAIKSNRNRISSVNQKISVSPIINMDQVMIDGLLSTTISTLESDVATKEAEIATKTTEITTLTSDLTTAQSDLATAQSNYNQLLASNTATVEQLTLAEAQVVSLQASLATAQSDLATAQSDLATLQSQLATAQASLTQAQSDLSTANASLATCESNLTTAQSDLATANTTIADLQLQLQNSVGPSGDVVPEVLNEDLSTWTYFDNGGTATISYSYDTQTEVHTFNLGAASSGSSYTSANPSYYPRWWRPLTYADGSPVLNTDSFIMQVRITDVSSTNLSANRALFVGITDIVEGPQYQSVAPFGVGVGCYTGYRPVVCNQTVSLANNTVLGEVGGVCITGGWGKVKMHASCAGYGNTYPYATASQASISGGSAGYYWPSANGTQLKFTIFAPATGTTHVPADVTISCKISYCVEKW